MRFWTVGPGRFKFFQGWAELFLEVTTVRYTTDVHHDKTVVNLSATLWEPSGCRQSGGLIADIRNVDGKLGRMEGFTRVLVLRLGLKYLCLFFFFFFFFDVVAISGGHVGD